VFGFLALRPGLAAFNVSSPSASASQEYPFHDKSGSQRRRPTVAWQRIIHTRTARASDDLSKMRKVCGRQCNVLPFLWE
jgi:hypothetical protein